MSDDFDDAFSRACRRAAEFRRSLADRSNPPQTDDHTLRQTLMAPLPEDGMPAADVVGELAGIAEPGLTAMPGPRFLSWVPGASHPAGVAADWLTRAWGQNTGYRIPTPATAALEQVAASWLLVLLDLPWQSSVGFATGATVVNAIGLAAAREAVLRAVDWEVEVDGLFGAPPIHVFIGDDAHTSLFSALQFIGLGHDRVVRIAIARRMAERLAAEPGVRVLNDVVLNQVIVEFGAGSGEYRKRTTETVINRVQAEEVCFVGGARWRDQWVMRSLVISYAITVEDAQRSIESILRARRDAGDFR